MYSCDACDYSTQYKGDLKKHIMFHEGIKKYICHNCGFKFTTSSDLQRHMRTHENVKNFICSFRSCGFSTSRIENLVNHESTHTSLEARLTHPCHLCKKSFSSRSILNRHMKTCSKPMNPNLPKEAVNTKCEICDKVFSNIYKLRQHQKNHSKELGKKNVFNLFGTFFNFFFTVQDFVCETCGKSFGTNESLLKHKPLHLDKKFSCDLCEKAFARADYLLKHRKTHFKVKSREELGWSSASHEIQVFYIFLHCDAT